MGCDIHFYVEKKVKGRWVSADTWTPYRWPDDEGAPKVEILRRDRFYDDRNYQLFGILAGVRTDSFVRIDGPRGLPHDLSAELREEHGDMASTDYHSHSWFTLKELLAYDWTQVRELSGWVNGKEYDEWNRWPRENGEGPKNYAWEIDENMREVTEDDLKSTVATIARMTPKRDEVPAAIEAATANTYAKVAWTQPYYKYAGTFLGETIPRMLRVGPLAAVRCVFWFDN